MKGVKDNSFKNEIPNTDWANSTPSSTQIPVLGERSIIKDG